MSWTLRAGAQSDFRAANGVGIRRRRPRGEATKSTWGVSRERSTIAVASSSAAASKRLRRCGGLHQPRRLRGCPLRAGSDGCIATICVFVCRGQGRSVRVDASPGSSQRAHLDRERCGSADRRPGQHATRVPRAEVRTAGGGGRRPKARSCAARSNQPCSRGRAAPSRVLNRPRVR